MSAENSNAVGAVCGVVGARAMLTYLEITHTESHCHIGLCLIKPNILWKLFGLDVPNVISAQVDGRKITLGTSSPCERVKQTMISSDIGPWIIAQWWVRPFRN